MMNAFPSSSTRAMRLFEAFAKAGMPQTLSELSRRIDTPMSTCHGLVKALQETGYLYSNRESRRLYPTKRLLRIAETISASDPVVNDFEPHMNRLRDRTGETVILGTGQGAGRKGAVVYLEVIESLNVIRYGARPGDLKPLHSSALGKLVLGEMPEAERSELLRRLPLDRVTDDTLTDPEALRADLDRSRVAGVYVTRGENVAEVMALAAPVRVSGELYGLAVAGPIERVSRRSDRIRAALLEVCAEIRESFE